MTITITADRFGGSFDGVETAIHALQTGIVLNATLVLGASHSQAAIEFAAANPRYCYGLELSVGSCWRALVGRSGQGALERALDRQLEIVVAAGVPISYVTIRPDWTGVPAFRTAIARALGHVGLARVRAVPLRGQAADPSSGTRFVGPERVYRPGVLATDWAAELLGRPLGRSLEVVVRPGTETSFARAHYRQAEILAALARFRGVSLIDWRQMPDETSPAVLPSAPAGSDAALARG